ASPLAPPAEPKQVPGEPTLPPDDARARHCVHGLRRPLTGVDLPRLGHYRQGADVLLSAPHSADPFGGPAREPDPRRRRTSGVVRQRAVRLAAGRNAAMESGAAVFGVCRRRGGAVCCVSLVRPVQIRPSGEKMAEVPVIMVPIYEEGPMLTVPPSVPRA